MTSHRSSQSLHFFQHIFVGITGPSWVPPTLPSWNEHGGIERRPRPGDLKRPENHGRTTAMRIIHQRPDYAWTTWKVFSGKFNLSWNDAKFRNPELRGFLCPYVCSFLESSTQRFWNFEHHPIFMLRCWHRIASDCHQNNHQNNQCIPWYPETISSYLYIYNLIVKHVDEQINDKNTHFNASICKSKLP